MFSADPGAAVSSSAVTPSSASLAGPPSLPQYPNLSARVPVRFDISVTDPERKGDGITQHICYRVNSLLEYNDASAEAVSQSCVIRRFSDWVWLRESLEADCAGLLIPALPDKALMGRFTVEFVEERRRALQLFLVRLMEHAILRRHAHVLLFLTGTDTALGVMRARSGEGIQKTATQGLFNLISSGVALVQSTIGPLREYPKSDEDLAHERMSEYTAHLQNELLTLEGEVDGWLSKEQALGKGWFNLGLVVSMLARTEGSGGRGANGNSGLSEYVAPPSVSSATSGAYTSFTDSSLGLGGDADLARMLQLLAQSSDTIAMLVQKKEAEEAVEFKEPIKDALRTAGAVESMLKRRSQCLSEYHSALDNCDSARAKLTTAQAGGGGARMPALENAVASAEAIAESKRVELSQMSAAVRIEFVRFQREKSDLLSAVVRKFIRMQLEHSTKITHVWQSVLNQVDQSASS